MVARLAGTKCHSFVPHIRGHSSMQWRQVLQGIVKAFTYIQQNSERDVLVHCTACTYVCMCWFSVQHVRMYTAPCPTSSSVVHVCTLFIGMNIVGRVGT